MHTFWLRALTGTSVLLATALAGHAQIVIPDINKDTARQIPPPGANPTQGSQNANRAGKTAPGITTHQFTPDPRCLQLPEALRRTTPGCH